MLNKTVMLIGSNKVNRAEEKANNYKHKKLFFFSRYSRK